MSDACVKHSFETAAGFCRRCENAYCTECLIYAFGPEKPPYCVTCALNAAGVRHQGARPNPRSRRRGWFRRRSTQEPEPETAPGFEDVHIELPESATNPEADRRFTRREIDPDVLAMVEESERAAEADQPPAGPAGPAGPISPAMALATRWREQGGDPLTDWADSLDGPRPSREPTTGDAEPVPWPEESDTPDPWA